MFGLISYYLSISGLMSSLRLSSREQAVMETSQEKANEAEETKTLDRLFEEIHSLFQESKMYTDPSLSLHQLAKAVSSNTSVLSRAINEKSGMNFNDFINSYRISGVKQSLRDGEMSNKTLVGIAMDNGFNSKSTFIRSFKKQEGITPSEYYKSLGED